jgi:hypothetical protein
VRGKWSLEVTKARFKSARARPTHRPRGRRGAVRDAAEIICDALYLGGVCACACPRPGLSEYQRRSSWTQDGRGGARQAVLLAVDVESVTVHSLQAVSTDLMLLNSFHRAHPNEPSATVLDQGSPMH